jgi:hypothetical protein
MRNRSETWLLSQRAWGSLYLLGMVAAFTAAGCGGSNQEPAQSPDPEAENKGPVGWSGANAPGQVEDKRGKFDEEQVKVVLARAAKNAHTCVDVAAKDAPHGTGTVTVTFAGKGRSTKASIGAPFDGTGIGQCVTRAFVDIIIPPFDGADVDKTTEVDLKPGPAEKAKKK